MCMLTKHVLYSTLHIIYFIKLWNYQYEYIYIGVIFIYHAVYDKMVNISCYNFYMQLFLQNLNPFQTGQCSEWTNEIRKLNRLQCMSLSDWKAKVNISRSFLYQFLTCQACSSPTKFSILLLNRFCTTKKVTFKLSYNIPFCNVEYKTKVIKESNFFISSCYVFSVLIFCLPYHHASDCCKGIW